MRCRARAITTSYGTRAISQRGRERLFGEARVERLKMALRDEALAFRRSIPSSKREQADARILAHLLKLPAYLSANTMFAYLSFGAEVDTHGVIEAAWADGKTVALPRCVSSRKMRWFRVSDLRDLEKGPLGVLEPRVDEGAEVAFVECERAIAVVPGLLFDGDGYRLGYGGGYYDAFLAGFPGTSVGLCRRAQLKEAPLPRGCHDLPVDIVVTDACSYKVRTATPST